jgi:uncharacterized protein with PIN domain
MTPAQSTATFRFYEELNDFLPGPRAKAPREYRFNGQPSIKDAIEAQGVPHTEVELIIVNGRSVGFDYHLRPGDHVAVYPVFESLDVSPLVKLRENPLRRVAFVLDVHLGALARLLRLLGLDVLYRNDYSDPAIVSIAAVERRIVLTRDQKLLHHKAITHGLWLRSQDPLQQTREVIRRFDLADQLHPFCRCVACNGRLEPVPKADILDRLEPKTILYYNDFYRCRDCNRIYWKGSHFDSIERKLREFTEKKSPRPVIPAENPADDP